MASGIISKAVIRGHAFGALIMTFFGVFWALGTMLGLTPLERVLLSIVTLVSAAVLSFRAFSLLRAARPLPDNPSPAAAAHGRSIARQFAVVGGIEIAAIVLASVLLGQADHSDLIPLVIALIVGIHFLPLAYIFQVRVYYFTGLIMSLLALIALIALFFGVALGGPYAWAIVVGLGNALILWLTALYVLSAGRRFLPV